LFNPCPKRKRVINKNLLKYVRGCMCIVPGCFVKHCDPAHIIKRSAWRLDIPGNVIPLCRKHHNEQEHIGDLAFFNKYNITNTILNNFKHYLILKYNKPNILFLLLYFITATTLTNRLLMYCISIPVVKSLFLLLGVGLLYVYCRSIVG